MAGLFREDGSLEVGDRTGTRLVRGRDQIRDLLRAITGDWERTADAQETSRYVRHIISTYVVDMTDRLSGRGSSYVTVVRECGLAS